MTNITPAFVLIGIYAAVASDPASDNSSPNRFEIIEDLKANWIGASMYCQRQGMRLGYFTSLEQQYLLTVLGDVSKRYWLSAAKLGKQTRLHWFATGHPVNYTYWETGQLEPTVHSEDKKDCVCLEYNVDNTNWQWNTVECDLENNFVCRNY